MSIGAGTRLGPYEVVAPLGAGGMGEVYRARDTRLDRTVAIKVLPAHLSENPTLRQRFEREARALSSLSHPNICVLHDVGRENGVDFLVMEYLEGETLSQRLEKGPLATEQVLRYGIEIADALDKAHRQGVVHRDLKPGNIILTKAGIKLLDFGLAKAATNVVGASLASLGSAPTQTEPLTGAGTIVGTFHYMAPEQLEGREADARSDIFALGAVLYEMASGQKAFPGKSQASIIAAVLSSEPAPLTQLRPLTPPALDRLVRTCLAKDPDERWQTAHDVGLNLKWIAEAGSQAGIPAPVVARRRWRQRLVWAGLALAVVAAAAASFGTVYYARQARELGRTIRSTLLPPENAGFGSIAVSPDGRRLAFTSLGPGGRSLLWVRALDSLAGQALAGTEGASFPFWSPDSRFIGFFADGKLRKIDATGGPPQTLCEAPLGRGGAWSRDGVIIFAPDVSGPLHRVSAAGGVSSPVTQLNESRKESSHRWPTFLPGGRHFLYLAFGGAPGAEGNAILVGFLEGGEPKQLVNAGTNMAYAPPRHGQPGYLLFAREGTLLAQPFDAADLELTGDAFPVAERVQAYLSFGIGMLGFSVSENGVLVYQPEGVAGGRVVWHDRSGKKLGALGEPAFYHNPQLSPDGKRLAVMSIDAQSRNPDVWVFDLVRGTRTRFTFDAGGDTNPIWSPDGSRIVFGGTRKGTPDLYQKAASGSGTEELLLESDVRERPSSWSADGRYIAFDRTARGGDDLWVLPLAGDPSTALGAGPATALPSPLLGTSGAGRKPFPILQTPFDEEWPMFSPNGRWLAYQSNESGQYQVYVLPFQVNAQGQFAGGAGGKWMVSTAGGRQPVWRRDGKELYYIAADNKLMAVEVRETLSGIEFATPRALFDVPPWSSPRYYTATADGQRFLVVEAEQVGPPLPLTLVVNWTAEFKKK